MTPQSKPPKGSRQPQGRQPQGRQPKSRALTRPQRRFSATHVTWASTAVVLIVVLALVLVYNIGNSAQQDQFGYAPASVVADVTGVPASVFNTIGIDSTTVKLYDLFTEKGQPALTTQVDGKTTPYSFYWGAEFCPYCAASRWGLIVALSRFGTFNKLPYMLSSSTDEDPNTPTFSFEGVTYTSKYFAFHGFEVEDRNHHNLDKVPSWIGSLVNKFNPNGYFPFMDFGNKVFVVGSVYDPGTLAGATQAEIAAGLTDTTSPITRAIIAEANYLTAAICTTVTGAPASVCKSSGVQTAIKALAKLPTLP